MKKLIVGVLAVFGVLSLLVLALVALIGLVRLSARPSIPAQVLLEIDFEQGIVESVPDDPLAQLMMENVVEVRDVVDALEVAAGDDRVKGFVARIGGGGIPMAQIQEIRDAVLRFRLSGKPAVAYAETFGEFGPGNMGYYLATAFDRIHLQPSGDVGLTGLMFQAQFLRGLFEKLDVEPQFDQRYEYKNAMNQYTETEMTAPHREALERIMDSRFEQIVDGIAESRGMTSEEVRALVNAGPYVADEALEANLVDGLHYRDEVLSSLREEVGERAQLLFVSRYLERAGRPHRKGKVVALIHGNGVVVRGPSTFSPLDGSASMGSDTVARAFRDAIDDSRVEAILFRVDSPGGSYVASDTIYRETLRAREAGKPVIVSMGNVAGSGGYFVAMAADKIVAQPGTITGSIGVLAGKLMTRDAWNKIGITYDDVQSSTNASLYSPGHEYTESGWERFQAALDRIYADFTGKVADGRELPIERVQEIARGRIWTGADALEIGLVDELGGFDVALRLLREAIEVEPDAALRIKRFPVKRPAIEAFLGSRPENSGRVAARAMNDVLVELRPVIRVLRGFQEAQSARVLSVPDASSFE